jgi:hypothetical protein
MKIGAPFLTPAISSRPFAPRNDSRAAKTRVGSPPVAITKPAAMAAFCT